MAPDKFIWKDEYSVKVQLIDEQHRIFFQITNRILDFINQPEISQRREALIDLVNDLENYALYHLGIEEEYFDQFHYDGAADHIAAHDQYRSAMKKIFNKARQESSDVNIVAKEATEYAGN